MDLPVYIAQVDETDETGLTFVSLVDKPAIEKDFLAFSKTPARFAVQNEEQRIVTGAAMIAGLPIYRKDDERGEYYIVFNKETIFNLAKKFAKGNKQNAVNLQHETPTEGVYMVESFFVNRDRGINAPKGFEDVADGSWFTSYFVENESVWADVKAGTFKGFSVEGSFGLEPTSELSEMLSDMNAFLNELRNFSTSKK